MYVSHLPNGPGQNAVSLSDSLCRPLLHAVSVTSELFCGEYDTISHDANLLAWLACAIAAHSLYIPLYDFLYTARNLSFTIAGCPLLHGSKTD